jgi:hypothetical protein
MQGVDKCGVEAASVHCSAVKPRIDLIADEIVVAGDTR